ncbi:LacI family DNA-binding transcriptional regulator [Diplocloster agilis]|uniref:LacI family DNA-binding transcriptional regulator n=1 Tax=Diplocloster agilis TaxID=2850323 RepID=A0A949NDR3_9FIRM|nr:MULTISPECIES: LacI family DNA-binding transcriptional regulator [Lachnospiraceae]MBU9735454.1 LacI family DNA-binding transcriptional regulator [Diplocloster agilis]MCU6733000.1 LacI family DNA-binding transcriptional regulator [Suonthocola fibrivorans]SCI71973.1 Degradation activator [uncultured Clostridium sp.]
MNLKDIAQAAQVSPATVSLVLHNKKGVNKETRERLTELLIQNGYVIESDPLPFSQTRSIRFLKYSLHSYLVDGNANFVSSMIDSIEHESRRLGYNLIMTSFDAHNAGEVFDMLRSQPQEDGLILLGTEWYPHDNTYLQELHSPLVIVDNLLVQEPYDCVVANNEQLSYIAVKHLADLGHPKIGLLANSLPTCNCQSLRSSYKSALQKLGLPFDSSLIHEVPPSLSGSYESTKALLRQGVTFPSAMLAINDCIALGAIKAFKEAGVRVPEDISVVGIDNISFSAISDPPLTTCNAYPADLGIWAVRLLDHKISHPDSPVQKMLIDGDLIIRNSTKKYKPR